MLRGLHRPWYFRYQALAVFVLAATLASARNGYRCERDLRFATSAPCSIDAFQVISQGLSTVTAQFVT